MFDVPGGDIDLSPKEVQLTYIEKALLAIETDSVERTNSILCNQDHRGATLLHYAMSDSFYARASLLLQKVKASNLNKALLICDDSKTNPLHLAFQHRCYDICLELIDKVSVEALDQAALMSDGRTPLQYALIHQSEAVIFALLTKITPKTLETLLSSNIHAVAQVLSRPKLKPLIEKIPPTLINYALLRPWPLFTISSVTNLKKTADKHNFIYLLLIWAYGYLGSVVKDDNKKQRISEIEDWWFLTHRVITAKENFYSIIKKYIENNAFFRTSWFCTSYKDIRNALLETRDIDDKVIAEAFNSYAGYLKLRQQASEDELEKKVVKILLDDSEPYLIFSKLEKTTLFGSSNPSSELLKITADPEPEPAKTISNAML